MTFGVQTSSTNTGPAVTASAQDQVLPSSGYKADSPGSASVNAGSALTLDDTYNGITVNLNTLTGSVVTLPPATGSGKRYKVLQTVLATSNSHKIQVANASDFFIGAISQGQASNAAGTWPAANSTTVSTNSDTITLNRTTTGGTVVGEFIEVTDVAANTWHVADGLLYSSGTAATPFSAAV